MLVTPPSGPDLVEYPEPVCSLCRLRAEQDAGSGATGRVLLDYRDLTDAGFHGTLEITLVFEDWTLELVTLDEVSLTNGELVEYEITAEQHWSWLEVEHVWVRMRPTAAP